MNTKKLLKKQGLMPKSSQANEMQVIWFFLFVVCSGFSYIFFIETLI